MTDALKPCPFCGFEAELREGEECAYVQCLGASYHRGALVDGDNDAAHLAVQAWNERKPERAAYLRGLEDAGAAIRNACNCDSALDAIRALAKEGGE